MDVIRPIPKSLLIHSGELLEELKGDWGSSGLNHLEDLNKIRVDPSSKIVRDKNNAEIQLAASMIYCCKNSRPSGQTFREDQIFDFNGMKHRIVSVEPFYDGNKLHHYEIGMVRYACKDNN
ncbi:MAG: minor capsid protein [Fusicatenibacter sp.]|nr:minor capsid protein [Fusicatenibacter sp.]